MMCSFHYTTLATIFQLICGFEVASSSKFRLPQIRLVGGKDVCEGRVEVRLQKTGPWGTVCDDLWRKSNADVACKELGYGPAEEPERRQFGPGKGRIAMDDVVCRGREKTLRACSYSAVSNCDHREDVGIRCSKCNPVAPTNTTWVEVVNGGWSRWSPWTECNATCGGGFKFRIRLCNRPEPQNGGARCVGKSEKKKKCGKKPCRQRLWTPWTEWSSCSLTCGNGTRFRERFCTDSKKCVGSNPKKDIETCSNPPCIVNLCDKFPCENGGSCIPLNGGRNFRCYCKLGFYGDHCETSCGCRKPTINPKILEASGVRESLAWPWNVLLKVRGRPSYLCSANLIHPEWLLTTSHCVEDVFPRHVSQVAPSDFKAVFDLDNRCRDPHTNSLAVSEIVMHPQFRATPQQHQFDYDIALFRLASPSSMATVCLPQQSCDDTIGVNRTKCFVVGFGKTAEYSRKASCKLLRMNVRMEKTWKCNSSKYHNGSITDRMFCAGRNGKDACEGDSGGQFACPIQGRLCRPDKSTFQICGLVSWGIGCGRLNKPGVYTNVYEFMPWIQKVIYSRSPEFDGSTQITE